VIFTALTLQIDDLPKPGPLNMAIDEVLARKAEAPLLRVYRWSDASVSFGYFGQYDAVAQRWPDRPLVRRWTGGGEVPHGDDFAYTLIVPRCEPFARMSIRESYHQIHKTLAGAIPGASLAESDAAPNTACFARPVVADIMRNGAKIAGAAQRRGTFGLLHQGSLQKTEWPARLAEEFARALSPSWQCGILEAETLEHASALAREKYATAEWLHRR